MNYFDVLPLSDFYLEDSYVLSIVEAAGSIVFELEAVLMESHPQYEKPKEGEKYCYRRVSLCFSNVDSVEWIDKRFMKFKDRAGELDYGNIDSFIVDDKSYTLSGDWGMVIVRGGWVEATLMD